MSRFIRETIHKEIRKQVEQSGLTRYYQIEVPSNWADISLQADFPDKGNTRILDEHGNHIGNVQWEMRFVVSGTQGNRRIEGIPWNTQFTRI